MLLIRENRISSTMSPTLYQLVKTIAAAILIIVCCSSLQTAKVKPYNQYRQNRDRYFKGQVKSVQEFNLKYNSTDSGELGHHFVEHFQVRQSRQSG